MSDQPEIQPGDFNFHADTIFTERVISRYLLRTLDEETAELFERHYFECDRCFEELRLAQCLMAGLDWNAIRRKTIGDVAVLGFAPERTLIRRAAELDELSRIVLDQKETKVLIDLSSVMRIDSAGLGVLMECYSHAVARRGALKLLRPSPNVRRALKVTRLDTLIESYLDESEALRAFDAR
jgi:anti-anti-sigma factor